MNKGIKVGVHRKENGGEEKKRKRERGRAWSKVDLHSAGLREDVGVDVHHKVASSGVLHDKAHVLAGLEAGEQVDQERVPHAVHRLKDALLAHETKHSMGGGRRRGKYDRYIFTVQQRLFINIQCYSFQSISI